MAANTATASASGGGRREGERRVRRPRGYLRSSRPAGATVPPVLVRGEVVRLGMGLEVLAGPAFGVAAGLLEVPGPVGLPGPFELPEPLDPADELPDPEAPAEPEELPEPAAWEEPPEPEAFGPMPAQVGLGDAAGLLFGDAAGEGLGL